MTIVFFVCTGSSCSTQRRYRSGYGILVSPGDPAFMSYFRVHVQNSIGEWIFVDSTKEMLKPEEVALRAETTSLTYIFGQVFVKGSAQSIPQELKQREKGPGVWVAPGGVLNVFYLSYARSRTVYVTGRVYGRPPPPPPTPQQKDAEGRPIPLFPQSLMPVVVLGTISGEIDVLNYRRLSFGDQGLLNLTHYIPFEYYY